MRRNGICGALAAVVLMAASEGAYAQQVVPENCSGNPGALATEFNTTHPGGQANTTYIVTGSCNGNFSVKQNNILIIGANNTLQTITGGITVSATNVGLQFLSIQGGTTGVFVSGPVQLTIQSSTIQNNGFGVEADFGAVVSTSSNTITGNRGFGISASDGAIVDSTSNTITSNGTGIFADHGAVIRSNSDTITGSNNFGIDALVGAVIEADSDTITGNTGSVTAQQGSTVVVNGGTISQSGPSGAPVVLAQDSSKVSLFGVMVTGPSPGSSHAVLVSRGSSALIQGSTITADVPFNANNVLAAVTAEQGSAITLAGSSVVTAINNMASGGAAVLVSGGSTFQEFQGLDNVTINGDGRVNTQSVIELGAEGFVGTLTWTGNVFVSQFSSFRANGSNVNITGTLSLGQAGNAYFNHTKGTSNNVAQVVCQSATDHVANPTLVNPNVMIGSPPGCQPF